MKIAFPIAAFALLFLSNAVAFVYYAPMSDQPAAQRSRAQGQYQGQNSQSYPNQDQNRSSYYYHTNPEDRYQQQYPRNPSSYPNQNTPYSPDSYSRRDGNSGATEVRY